MCKRWPSDIRAQAPHVIAGPRALSWPRGERSMHEAPGYPEVALACLAEGDAARCSHGEPTGVSAGGRHAAR